MTILDPELKTKWLAALRSGEYKQGVGAHYDKHTDTFCGLGVLLAVSLGGKEEYLKLIPKGESDIPNRWSMTRDLIGNRAPGIYMISDRKGNTFEDVAKFVEAKF